MATVWSGFNTQVSTHDGPPSVEFNDLVPGRPCTLLRSMVWTIWQGFEPYEIGASGVPIGPVGYAFGDLNSRNNDNPFPPDNSPGNAKVALIAYDEVAPQYTALGFPPNSTGHLSGSVNDINSSGTLATDYNINAFMYASARSFVDSKAERIFDTIPTYQFTGLFFGGFGFQAGNFMISFTWRGLYQLH